MSHNQHKKLIVQEIKRGLEIVNDVMTSKTEWKLLFIGTPFFQRYKHYIILLLSAPEQNQFLEWSGLVEAKIRILIGNLERNSYIDIAHVNSDKYTPDESVFDQQQTNKTATENDSSNRTNGHHSPGTIDSFSFNTISNILLYNFKKHSLKEIVQNH